MRLNIFVCVLLVIVVALAAFDAGPRGVDRSQLGTLFGGQTPPKAKCNGNEITDKSCTLIKDPGGFKCGFALFKIKVPPVEGELLEFLIVNDKLVCQRFASCPDTWSQKIKTTDCEKVIYDSDD